jgi:hypothetical protein
LHGADGGGSSTNEMKLPSKETKYVRLKGKKKHPNHFENANEEVMSQMIEFRSFENTLVSIVMLTPSSLCLEINSQMTDIVAMLD